MNLAELLDRTELDVLDHLELDAAIPVLDGPQAQGDLIILPMDLVPDVEPRPWPYTDVPREGVELIRGEAGTNPHTLVADPHTCRWTRRPRDPLGLAIAMFANEAPVYLIHPEHGGSGVAPGRWLVRRQQEMSNIGDLALVAD